MGTFHTLERPAGPATGRHGADGRFAREAGVLAAGAAVYFGVRVVVEGSRSEAVGNAERLLDLERTLGIDIEHDVQQLALDHDLVRVVGNLSYVWLHWPLLITVLAVLFLRHPAGYRRLRNAMFLSGAVGLILFTIIPMAPPRFMPGFIGTVSDSARRHYLTYPLSWTNEHAAFPSFHVGWTLIACLAVAGLAHTPARKAVLMAPAVLVAISVVSTGNHYVLDSVAGVAIALGAHALLRPPGPGEVSEEPVEGNLGGPAARHRNPIRL